MKFSEILSEIEEIPITAYKGGSRDLDYKGVESKLIRNSKPLPGDSGYMYNIIMYGSQARIIIFEKEMLKKTGQAIGKLLLDPVLIFPIQPCYKVDVITTHEDFRGKGIAKSLYGIAMLPSPVGLDATLISGDMQTPSGQKNWVSLSQIPGVEVSGWLQLHDIPDGYIPDKEDLLQKIIDDLYGKLGAQYLGDYKSIYIRKHYFEFPVSVSKSKLENTIKNSIIKVYSGISTNSKHYIENYDVLDMIDTGLMARYTG